MGFKLGMNGKVYWLDGARSTWGAADSNGMNAGADPGLNEVVQIHGDVTINIDDSEADISIRGNGGWKATAATLSKATVEFQMVYDPADLDYLALMKSWLGNSSIPLAILNGSAATAGVQGLWADFEVMNISKAEPIDGAQLVTITAKPTLTAVAPEWVIVA